MEAEFCSSFFTKLRQNVERKKAQRYYHSQFQRYKLKQLFLKWRSYRYSIGLNIIDIKKIQRQKLLLYVHILNNKCKRRRYIRSLYYLAHNIHSIFRYKSCFFNWFKFMHNQNKINIISKAMMLKRIKGKRYAYCTALKRGLEKLRIYCKRFKVESAKNSIGCNFHLILHKSLYQRDFFDQLKSFIDRSTCYKKDIKGVARYYRYKIASYHLNRWIQHTANKCKSRMMYQSCNDSKNIVSIMFKHLKLFFFKWISYKYSRVSQCKLGLFLAAKSDKNRIRYQKLQALHKLVMNNPLNGEKIRFIEYFRYRNITLPIYIRTSFRKLLQFFKNKIDRNRKFRLKCNKLLHLHGKNIFNTLKMKTLRVHTLFKHRNDIKISQSQYLRHYFTCFRKNIVRMRNRRDVTIKGYNHYVRIKLQLLMKKRWRWVMKTKALILYDRMLMRKVFLGLKLYTKENMELVELGKQHVRNNAFPLILSRFKIVRAGKRRFRKSMMSAVLFRSKYLCKLYFHIWRRYFKTHSKCHLKIIRGIRYFREIYTNWALTLWIKSHINRCVSKDENYNFKHQLVMKSFNTWMRRASVYKFRARRNRGCRVVSKVSSLMLKVMPLRGDYRLLNQQYAIKATTRYYLYNKLSRSVFDALLKLYRMGRKNAKIFKYLIKKLKRVGFRKIYLFMKNSRQQQRLRRLSLKLFKEKSCSKVLKELQINRKIEICSKFVKLVLVRRYFYTYRRTYKNVSLMKRTINLMIHDYKVNLLTSAFSEWRHDTICEKNIIVYTHKFSRTFKLSKTLIYWYFYFRRRKATMKKHERRMEKMKHNGNKAKVIHNILRYIEKKYATKDKMIVMGKYYNNYTCRSVLLNLLFFRRKRIADEHFKKLASARFIKMLRIFSIKSMKEKRKIQKALIKLKHSHFIQFVKVGTSHTKSKINIRKIVVQYGKLKFKGQKLKIYEYTIKAQGIVYEFLYGWYTKSIFRNKYKKLCSRLLRRSKYSKMYEYCRQLYYLKQVKHAFKILLFNRRSRRHCRFVCDVMNNHNKKKALMKCVRKLDLFVCDRFGMSEVIRSMSMYHSNTLFQKRGLKAFKLNIIK